MNAQLLETKDNTGGNVYMVLISLCAGVSKGILEKWMSAYTNGFLFSSVQKKIEKASMLTNSYS